MLRRVGVTLGTLTVLIRPSWLLLTTVYSEHLSGLYRGCELKARLEIERFHELFLQGPK